VGGHCLPIDPCYLSWQVRRRLNRQFRFIELANDINHNMPDHVVRRVMVDLNRRGRALSGSRILLAGLSYKKNTADMRDSPAVEVAIGLQRMGAKVYAAEPHAELAHIPAGVNLVDLTEAEARRAAAVVVLTDHDAFDYEALPGWAC
jgi:UDP-N-acetyl-D-glucosamine dehydrogenase